MTITPGSRVGQYEIISRIGAGGMGEVFRARDTRIGRDVAIKLLPPAFAADAERLRRFELEARSAGSLNHPNLVTIHELGIHDGAPYIAMELLDGETLRDKMTATGSPRLPIRKAVDYSVQIANGLAAAHDKGVVHRDLKPENVFITKDGRVKILDFGLAKSTGSSDGDVSQTMARNTEPGVVMGTAGYMSPEQVRGQHVDHRTDIFSFGAILYEMVSGRRAFQRGSSVETMNSVLKDDPPDVGAEGVHVSPALDRIVRRCLEKNAEERFHSAHDVAYALEAISGTASTSAREAALAGDRKSPVIALVIAVAIALIAVAFFAGRMSKRVAAPIDQHFQQLTFDSTVVGGGAISPDGNSFAYVDNRTSNADIYVQRIGGSNAINITKDSPDDDTQPAFSPDGEQIAFRSERDGGGIFIMGATGESVRRLTDFGFDPAWSPDGKSIAVATEHVLDPTARLSISKIWIVDVATGSKRELKAGTDLVQPSWSPDGKHLVAWGIYQGGQRVIWTLPSSGGTPVRITTDRAFNWSPVWSPDGHYIYYASSRGGTMNLWRIAVTPDDAKPSGDPEPVTSGTEWCAQPSIARDGHTLLTNVHSRDGELYSVPLDPATLAINGPAAPVIGASRKVLASSISPDGQWIAFSTTGGQEDLFIVRKDGTGLLQLTDDVFKDRGPHFSPDGSRIAFYSDRGGTYDAWAIRRDGSGLQQITRGIGVVEPVWSPDGKLMSGFEFDQRRGVIFPPVPGAKLTMLPLVEGTSGFWPHSWAPDGHALVGTVWNPDGTEHGIATYDMTTHRFEKLSDRGTYAIWVKPNVVMFTDNGGVFVEDVTTKAVRAAGALPTPPALLRFSLAPDSSRLYYRTGATDTAVWMVQLRN